MQPACDSDFAGVTGPFPGTVGEIVVSGSWTGSYDDQPPNRAEITPVLLKTKDLGVVWRPFAGRFGVDTGLFGLTPANASASTLGINGLRGVLSQC